MIITEKDYSTFDFDYYFDQFASSECLPLKGNYGECPCKQMHNAESGKRDFYAFLGSANDKGFRNIGVKCFHDSCKESLRSYAKTLNKTWWHAVNSNDIKSYIVTPSMQEERIKAALAKFEADYKQEQILNEKKKRILDAIVINPLPPYPHASPTEDTQYHLRLFKKGDVIYFGSKFSVRGCLLNLGIDPIQDIPEFTSTYTFHDANGVDVCGERKYRVKQNIKDKPYGVLEIDDHSPLEHQLAMLHAIEKVLNIRMIMAVHSGSKSIHGWFHYADIEPHLKLMKMIGYDMNTLCSAGQPVRLAGAYRKEKERYQRIVYVGK